MDKDDMRIEVNGQIDMLNAMLGEVRAMLSADDVQRPLLLDIQRFLMLVMSHVATSDSHGESAQTSQTQYLTSRLEQVIDQAQGSGGLVIPGDTVLSARIHVARTQARTVERRLWSLHRVHPVNAQVLIFMNRLSDYLYAISFDYLQ